METGASEELERKSEFAILLIFASDALSGELLKLDHLNLVFIGHVDAGKSTVIGRILYLTGVVEERTMEKYRKEAAALGRESWMYAFAVDTTEGERAKGKTEECGRANFYTANKRFTILDAPGHKLYIPNMISGTTQADVGVLIISAKKGEFEAGFDRGGQTREHAMLAKISGIRTLIVAVNKMDDETVNWSKERYDEINSKLKPYLKTVGYSLKTNLHFLPISGLADKDDNIVNSPEEDVSAWYKGKTLLETLDSIGSTVRTNDFVRLPISEKFKDMGVFAIGKLEAGIIKVGDKLVSMPNEKQLEIQEIYIDDIDVQEANAGDTLKIRVKGIEDEDIRPGDVLCNPENLCPVTSLVEAKLIFLELKSILSNGYECMFHAHTAMSEVMLQKIISLLEKKTGEVLKKHPKFVKSNQHAICRLKLTSPICAEKFSDFNKLGRFVLRDEGNTIAVGVVQRLRPEGGIQ